MALLGLGWQEKVGPLQASGSGQGGDQTPGSREEQGRALSVVLHGAGGRRVGGPCPSPPSPTTEVPLLGLCAPQDRLGGHPAAPSQCSCRHSQRMEAKQEQKSPQASPPAQLLLSRCSIALSFTVSLGRGRPGHHIPPPQTHALVLPAARAQG